MSRPTRFSRLEILGWGVILLILLSYPARILFGEEVREGEARFAAFLGISPPTHEILKLVAAVVALVYLLGRHGPFRRKH